MPRSIIPTYSTHRKSSSPTGCWNPVITPIQNNLALDQVAISIWYDVKTYHWRRYSCYSNMWKIMYTSSGVKGHFPSTRFAPGLITLPLLLNFPLQLLSRAMSISRFSASPPSYSQHEKATISLIKRDYILGINQDSFKFSSLVRWKIAPLRTEDVLIHIYRHSVSFS